MCGDGCDGGYPIRAWKYFVQNGVVTEEVIIYFNITFSSCILGLDNYISFHNSDFTNLLIFVSVGVVVTLT